MTGRALKGLLASAFLGLAMAQAVPGDPPDAATARNQAALMKIISRHFHARVIPCHSAIGADALCALLPSPLKGEPVLPRSVPLASSHWEHPEPHGWQAAVSYRGYIHILVMGKTALPTAGDSIILVRPAPCKNDFANFC